MQMQDPNLTVLYKHQMFFFQETTSTNGREDFEDYGMIHFILSEAEIDDTTVMPSRI